MPYSETYRLAVAGSADIVRPDDRAWRGVGTAPTIVPIVSPSMRVDHGFDWIDAGIGAAGTLGLALLLAGASVIAVRRNRVVTHS